MTEKQYAVKVGDEWAIAIKVDAAEYRLPDCPNGAMVWSNPRTTAMVAFVGEESAIVELPD